MSAIRLRAKRTDWRACSSTCSGVMRNFLDRKSTRLNSSHLVTSYAVFCLKKKTKGHDGIRAELDDIDGDLPERLRGVDDRDRSGVAGETACFADRQHVPGLARGERDEECP